MGSITHLVTTAPTLPVTIAAGDDVSLFGRRLDNAGRAALWLAEHGISILGLAVTRHGATLTVPCDPRLWRIFRDQCAWRKRRQVGRLTIYTWVAVLFATRIEWEHTQCC